MTEDSPSQRGRFSMPGGPIERRVAFITIFLLLPLLYILKLTLPHQTIHYAMDSLQGYANTSYTHKLHDYLIPIAPLVASAVPGDLKGGQAGATKVAGQAAKLPGIPSKGSVSSQGSSDTAVTSPFDISVSTKVAVIVENRIQGKLIPLILHFAAILGPEWPIIIYTSTESVGMFSASAAFNRHRASGRIQIRMLPITILFTNSNSVNAFFTKSWIWRQLAPAEHILLFQADSMLCANAARSVEEFFKFDFVGAPIAENLGRGYNGGLSLRRRSLMEHITTEWDWETDPGSRFEDQWFFDRLNEMQERGERIVLPSMEVARTFSVETIDFPHPLGVHQVHRWLGAGLVPLDEWCPEYKLCSEDHVIDA